MQLATLGDDDEGRLAELRAYGVLDTGAEDSLDNLARIAAVLCDVPIVLIALVDRDREWFKARIGVNRREVPRASGLCAQAILQDELLEIPDVAKDPRFGKNLLVIGEPHVRFFAGMPLISPRGYRLGALCVLDQRPRLLNQTQYDTLHVLAAQVMENLDARRRLRELISANGASARLRLAPDPAAAAADTPTVDLLAGARLNPGAAEEPQQCGRFKILRRVGVGGMATVYAALDPELDRCIAIKLLHGDSNPESWARLQREAQALARISHPHVIQIFEIGVYGAQVFVAMELVDGLTLSAWTKARPRSLADIVGVYVQAGRGLVAAHSAGIIHRDFKPENVIVGSDGCAKIVDFGIARMLHTSANSPPGTAGPGRSLEVTQAGAIVGTPAYMSPEQYSCGAIDERSDQFNYCASLFEALYGQRPFVGATLAELQTNIVEGLIQVPAAPEGVPAALHRALLQGLAPDPAKRWDSLAHLLDYLARFARSSDPGSERERRVLVRLLIALVVFVAIILGYRFASLPLTDGPSDLVLIADGALALGLTVAWFVRNTLLVDRVHRRMIGIILFVLAADCISRVGGMLADFSVFHILLAEMLSVSVGLSALALFVQPSLWLLAGMFLLGAIAVVLAADPVPIAAMVFLGSIVLFALEWRRAARDGIAWPR